MLDQRQNVKVLSEVRWLRTMENSVLVGHLKPHRQAKQRSHLILD